MSEPLNPCPFCGGEADFERYGDSRQSTQVLCSGCGCLLEGPEEFGHGGQWNRRPMENELLEACKAIKSVALETMGFRSYSKAEQDAIDLVIAAIAKAEGKADA